MVQWLSLRTFSVGGMGSISGRGTGILHASVAEIKYNKKAVCSAEMCVSFIGIVHTCEYDG